MTAKGYVALNGRITCIVKKRGSKLWVLTLVLLKILSFLGFYAVLLSYNVLVLL